ncbi:GNAT family N-acetyltransferase [Aquimarina sp. BL5]|uniref:GNAT family N-acetyltransferase n=1 Tax=Aquimarina sp. BL5 TaxID=1714860 RepID=UPI000E519649|nr:GNAT family N-acetyltransferase [Aquimarina sp. BL5]AXT50789.1 GNAT family N-acetyltransferase [Aquimarina sp. BL5]RKN04478.1 GNAT family N-acetyltransferase [Aquimarina sp. BL5]
MAFEIEFQRCTKDDIEALVKISKQFYPEHYSHIWENEDTSFYVDLSFTTAAFKKDFETENIIYFLVKRSEKILGMLKLRKHQELVGFKPTEALQLEKIYLLAEATGLGIGTHAMNFTKNFAKKLNKKVIWLDVMTTSPAIQFYKKLGFKTISYYNLDYPRLKDGYREMQRMTLPI